jgi:ribosomal protein S27AE
MNEGTVVLDHVSRGVARGLLYELEDHGVLAVMERCAKCGQWSVLVFADSLDAIAHIGRN